MIATSFYNSIINCIELCILLSFLISIASYFLKFSHLIDTNIQNIVVKLTELTKLFVNIERQGFQIETKGIFAQKTH